jgi:hypothetical protein
MEITECCRAGAALAERIGRIREQYDTAEIALHQALAFLNAITVEADRRLRAALADRIGKIRER